MITIELPDDLFGSLQMISNKKNLPELNKVITHVLKTFVDEKRKRLNDPIFLSITEKGSGITDVSEEHDKYLYGN